MKDNFNRYVLKSFGVVFGSIVIATAAFYFLAGDTTSRSSDIADHRALIAKGNDSLTAFVEIKNNTAEAAGYKTAMDKLLPAQNELINFPQWLQNVAAPYNITANFSFTASTVPATAVTPGTIGFSITVEGNNSNVLSFLNNLESQAPGFLLVFDTISFSQNGSDLKAVVGGRMFFR